MPTARTAPSPDPIAGKLQSNRDSRPVPDPTVLTTQQLQREVMMLRELIETRMDAMEKAVELLQSNADKAPSISVVERMVIAQRELHQEKFDSIAIQFKERDTRTEQMALATKIAVDAALQAAKEAVGEQNRSSAQAITKSETATIKQIDQIGVLLQTTEKATSEKFSDMKDRLMSIEGRAIGGLQAQSRSGDVWGYVFGGVGMLIGVVTLIVLIATLMQRSHP